MSGLKRLQKAANHPYIALDNKYIYCSGVLLEIQTFLSGAFSVSRCLARNTTKLVRPNINQSTRNI